MGHVIVHITQTIGGHHDHDVEGGIKKAIRKVAACFIKKRIKAVSLYDPLIQASFTTQSRLGPELGVLCDVM
eukprot:12894879-Prorocentrum_lima.AAC.1